MSKGRVGYEILQNLGKIQRGRISVELNLMKWGFGKPTYDLRPWEGEGEERSPWKGCTFSKGELRELRDILNNLPLEDEEAADQAQEQKAAAS